MLAFCGAASNTDELLCEPVELSLSLVVDLEVLLNHEELYSLY